MQREELSKLIDNLVEQAIRELREGKESMKSSVKALVIVPETVFSLHKYEEYFVDIYKGIDFTFACFFNTDIYKEKKDNIKYISLDEEGQLQVSNRIDEFDRLFIIVNDMLAIDKILSGDCNKFVRELIGYYNMHEKNISLVTSYKKSLKLNTAIKSRRVKLKNSFIDLLNIHEDDRDKEYDTNELKEKKVITEKEIHEAYSAGVDLLQLDKKQLVTPLAKDRARDYGIKIAY